MKTVSAVAVWRTDVHSTDKIFVLDGAQHSESPSSLGKRGPGPGARTRARGALYEGKGPIRYRLLLMSTGKTRPWTALYIRLHEAS